MYIAAQFIIPVGLGITFGLILYLILYNPSRFQIKKNINDLYLNKDMTLLFDNAIKERKKKRKLTDTIKTSDKFAAQIESADLPVSANEFLLIWGASTITPPVIVALITQNMISALGVGIIGFAVPCLYFMKKQNDRRNAFSLQLGDALLTISNGLRAGFSFQQAMRSIAKDMMPPISTEFAKVLNEIDYGMPQEEALKRMYVRLQNEDLKMLISALAIADKTGGNLSDVLFTISTTVQNRIKIRQEVKTLSAQGKISSIIIGALPIVIILIMMVMNPDYIETLTTTDTGRKLLVVAAIMEVIGFAVMNKITDVKL